MDDLRPELFQGRKVPQGEIETCDVTGEESLSGEAAPP